MKWRKITKMRRKWRWVKINGNQRRENKGKEDSNGKGDDSGILTKGGGK